MFKKKHNIQKTQIKLKTKIKTIKHREVEVYAF